MSFIEIKGLEKSYFKHKALKGINLEINEGEIVGLFGPNGSGKTTLIKILANLLMRYNGDVLIDGKRPGAETKKIVSYLPDVNYLEEKWTVLECVKVFEKFYEDFDSERAKNLLEKFHIELKSKVKSLSKGNKEKLQVILVLSRRAKLYLFDEPIAGVDPASRDVIFNLIMQNYDKRATVILTTHLISDIEDITDRVIFINEGNVFLDNTKENLKEIYPDKTIDQIFREVFKVNFLGGDFNV